MWRLTEWGKTRLPLPGVPWRDMTDAEFRRAEAKFPPGVLRERGYFEQVGSSESRVPSAGSAPPPKIDDERPATRRRRRPAREE